MKKLFPLFLSVSIFAFNASTFAMEEETDDLSNFSFPLSPPRQIELGQPLSIEDLKDINNNGRIQTSQGVFQLVEAESFSIKETIGMHSKLTQLLFDRECRKILNCHTEQLAEKDLEILNKLDSGFIYYFATVGDPSPWGGILTFQKISN